ncbi:hypothetical protein C922_03437 [Plasmodium inui San Antonio 1]|uniref:Uncharacterized protein n=1 Tax=Plasmodium inui San Antonio 1 TaxID=1237626 RepID=W6ZZB6_9APIC|nr:hypothetical protein C922_03437 [Plasmodium inui San Antonio 1]EUD66242.1 hypothetical protein C922_03437 [Plasmodium inui San Antonio 1]
MKHQHASSDDELGKGTTKRGSAPEKRKKGSDKQGKQLPPHHIIIEKKKRKKETSMKKRNIAGVVPLHDERKRPSRSNSVGSKENENDVAQGKMGQPGGGAKANKKEKDSREDKQSTQVTRERQDANAKARVKNKGEKNKRSPDMKSASKSAKKDLDDPPVKRAKGRIGQRKNPKGKKPQTKQHKGGDDQTEQPSIEKREHSSKGIRSAKDKGEGESPPDERSLMPIQPSQLNLASSKRDEVGGGRNNSTIIEVTPSGSIDQSRIEINGIRLGSADSSIFHLSQSAKCGDERESHGLSVSPSTSRASSRDDSFFFTRAISQDDSPHVNRAVRSEVIFPDSRGATSQAGYLASPSLVHTSRKERGHSISHSVSHSVGRSIALSAIHSIGHSASHSVGHPISPLISHLGTDVNEHRRRHESGHSVSHSVSHSVGHSVGHSISPLVSHSVSHSVSHCSSPSVSRPSGLSISHAIGNPVNRLNDLPIGQLISRVRGGPPPPSSNFYSNGGISGDASSQGHNQPRDTYGKSLFSELTEAMQNDSTQTNEKSNISIRLKAEEEEAELQISMNETTVRKLRIQKDNSKRSIDLIHLSKELKSISKDSAEMGKGTEAMTTLRSSRKGSKKGTNLRVKAKGKRPTTRRGSDIGSGSGIGSGIRSGNGHGKRSGDSNIVQGKAKVRKKDAASRGRTKLIAPPVVKRPSRRGKRGRMGKAVAKMDQKVPKMKSKKEAKREGTKEDGQKTDKTTKEKRKKIEESNKMSREAANKMSREAANKMSREAANKVSRETEDKMSQKAEDKMSREAANKMSAEEAIKISVEEVTKMSIEEVTAANENEEWEEENANEQEADPGEKSDFVKVEEPEKEEKKENTTEKGTEKILETTEDPGEERTPEEGAQKEEANEPQVTSAKEDGRANVADVKDGQHKGEGTKRVENCPEKEALGEKSDDKEKVTAKKMKPRKGVKVRQKEKEVRGHAGDENASVVDGGEAKREAAKRCVDPREEKSSVQLSVEKRTMKCKHSKVDSILQRYVHLREEEAAAKRESIWDDVPDDLLNVEGRRFRIDVINFVGNIRAGEDSIHEDILFFFDSYENKLKKKKKKKTIYP